MKKIYIKIAGIINLITVFIHLIGGQMDLVNPLIYSNLEVQQKTEWVGVWHMVTIFLFATTYLILKVGFTKTKVSNLQNLKFLGMIYVLMGIPFIISSMYFSVLAPQWILLMPIGILLLLGLKKQSNNG